MSLWKYLVTSEHLELLDATEAKKTAALAGDSHIESWRIRYRLKTVCVALVICLNVGVDPPDVVKPKPCARLECWIDPTSVSSQKAIESIGKALQLQYERWQPKARYKVAADPTVEEVKKLCTSLRRSAKEERVLFHYNGHGVPRPTANGEIWVFNKNYTQYIPLSLYDLQSWLGVPSILVFDCSAAGLALSCFLQLAEHRMNEHRQGGEDHSQQVKEQEYDSLRDSERKIFERESPSSQDISIVGESMSFKDCIILAACRSDEFLPTHPQYPADIFTSCLTTPIKIALRWFLSKTLIPGLSVEMLDHIPGKLNDRKTMLGELNWIFTAITDTIAWNVLPRPLFKRLFRQDLLVASLFRNYILAERIMKSLNCTPVTYPELPSMCNHHLWKSWDYTMELCLAQLPAVLSYADSVGVSRDSMNSFSASVSSPTVSEGQSMDNMYFGEDGRGSRATDYIPYDPIPFFDDHITAFEVWLDMADEQEDPPEQLPIILQVLLSQSYRLRALRLLSRFCELGSWAVDLCLSVGIFPYILKLLQSPSKEIREELVFIWGKIICQDHSCAVDLARDNGHIYFIDFLDYPDVPEECKAMALFVISIVSSVTPEKLKETRILRLLIENSKAKDSALVRKWALLCMAKCFKHDSFAKEELPNIEEMLRTLRELIEADESPEVRAATIYVLEFFPYIKFHDITSVSLVPAVLPSVTFNDSLLPFILYILWYACQEASPIVRRESAKLAIRARKNLREQLSGNAFYEIGTLNTVLQFLWDILQYLSMDPQMEVSAFVREVLKDSSGSHLHEEHSRVAGAFGSTAEHTGVDTLSTVSSSLSSSPENGGLIRRELSKSTSAMPRVMSIEGISHLIRGFTSAKGRYVDSQSKPSSCPSASVLNEKSSNLNDTLWHLPSLYDWSHGAIMNLRAPSHADSPRSSTNIENNTENNGAIVNCKYDIKIDNDSVADSKVKASKEVAILDIGGGSVTSLSFASGSTIFVGSSKGEVSEWDYQKGIRRHMFSNSETPVSYLFSGGELEMRHVDDMVSMILTGSSCGLIKLWRLNKTRSKTNVICSWHALKRFRDDTQNETNSSLVMAWNSVSSRIATNSYRIGCLNIWDIQTERLWRQIELGSSRNWSSLTWTSNIELLGPHVIFGGTHEGLLTLIDTRCSEHEALNVQPVESNNQPQQIVGVLSQITGTGSRLLSASAAGNLIVWDPRRLSNRKDGIVMSFEVFRNELTTVAARSNASTVAVGSNKNSIRIFGSQGSMLRMIRYHEGSMSSKIGSVSSMTYHQENANLAFGCTDSLVSVYE
eukprot:jgi/Galph1/5966/GphlegSOOS_G4585.1